MLQVSRQFLLYLLSTSQNAASASLLVNGVKVHLYVSDAATTGQFINVNVLAFSEIVADMQSARKSRLLQELHIQVVLRPGER